jgi:hypothetical protein
MQSLFTTAPYDKCNQLRLSLAVEAQEMVLVMPPDYERADARTRIDVHGSDGRWG